MCHFSLIFNNHQHDGRFSIIDCYDRVTYIHECKGIPSLREVLFETNDLVLRYLTTPCTIVIQISRKFIPDDDMFFMDKK